MGPRKQDGKYVPHSILGDVEDFVEMEQVYSEKIIEAPVKNELKSKPITLVIKISLTFLNICIFFKQIANGNRRNS